MPIKAIDSYLTSDLKNPFFVSVGDKDYKSLTEGLSTMNFSFVKLSDLCSADDKFPDLDKLYNIFLNPKAFGYKNRVAVLGLGEYLSFRGKAFAINELNELKFKKLGDCKAVLIVKGIESLILSLASDIRFDERHYYTYSQSSSEVSVVVSPFDIGKKSITGFKEMLSKLENGKTGTFCVNSGLMYDDSLYAIKTIKSPYDAIIYLAGDIGVKKELGTDGNWSNLLTEMVNNSNQLSTVFSRHFAESDSLYDILSDTEYVRWLYFIYLKINIKKIHDDYLLLVLNDCDDAKDFKDLLIRKISDVNISDEKFDVLYALRKNLLRTFPENEIAAFVAENRYDTTESIYRLTDNTLTEKKEIVALVSQYGVSKQRLETIYPDLSIYLKKYEFSGTVIDKVLTEYFEGYKQNKIRNTIDDDFLELVNEHAVSRAYNRLEPRDSLVDKFCNPRAVLCWIDALGVEYLGFIENYAQSKGLIITTKIGRCELPSITSINKEFYDSWPYTKKPKVSTIDDCKHHECGGYVYGPEGSIYPIHLAEELDTLKKVIDSAATDLALNKYDSFIIASDHGASRLAVIKEQEEKYETDFKGEHSGRCCKEFKFDDLPFAFNDNGYTILADYGRFKNSRKANVEVHGGGTFEEVVVPVIKLSLKDNSLSVKMVGDSVQIDKKNGTVIEFFINKPINDKVSVVLNGNSYIAEKKDPNHFIICVDVKRPKVYDANIYLNEDLISTTKVNLVSGVGKSDSDFSELF